MKAVVRGYGEAYCTSCNHSARVTLDENAKGWRCGFCGRLRFLSPGELNELGSIRLTMAAGRALESAPLFLGDGI